MYSLVSNARGEARLFLIHVAIVMEKGGVKKQLQLIWKYQKVFQQGII